MLTAEAHIRTAHASRYLVQFCRHADNISHRLRHLHAGAVQARPEVLSVEWSETRGVLTLNWGRCTMQAGSDMLMLRVEAVNEENLRQIQDIIAGNLERFGRRDHLAVTWRPVARA